MGPLCKFIFPNLFAKKFQGGIVNVGLLEKSPDIQIGN